MLKVCDLVLLLPNTTVHFLSQFHFANGIYSVLFKNAKYAYRVGALAPGL